MRVGSSSSIGKVTSPTLGVEGNVVLLIKTGCIVSGAKFKVSIVGMGTAASKDYTVEEGESYRPSAILIKGSHSMKMHEVLNYIKDELC